MADKDDKSRFVATAEDVRPMGRPFRSEDRSSPEDRKAQAAAQKALKEALDGADDD